MNWHAAGINKLPRSQEVTLAEHEDQDALPTAKHLIAAKTAAATLAKALGGDVAIDVQGHETLTGDGFRPAHITITVSRLDPAREQDA